MFASATLYFGLGASVAWVGLSLTTLNNYELNLLPGYNPQPPQWNTCSQFSLKTSWALCCWSTDLWSTPRKWSGNVENIYRELGWACSRYLSGSGQLDLSLTRSANMYRRRTKRIKMWICVWGFLCLLTGFTTCTTSWDVITNTEEDFPHWISPTRH